MTSLWQNTDVTPTLLPTSIPGGLWPRSAPCKIPTVVLLCATTRQTSKHPLKSVCYTIMWTQTHFEWKMTKHCQWDIRVSLVQPLASFCYIRVSLLQLLASFCYILHNICTNKWRQISPVFFLQMFSHWGNEHRLRVCENRKTLGTKWQENGEKCTVRSFMICNPHQKGNQIKEDEIGRICGMHGREEKCICDLVGKSDAKDH